MGEPCIRVQNLTKSFAGRRVVDDLSFAVEKGEVFALPGHNGAGKSITVPVITLIAITVVCGTVAVKTFRWE